MGIWLIPIGTTAGLAVAEGSEARLNFGTLENRCSKDSKFTMSKTHHIIRALIEAVISTPATSPAAKMPTKKGVLCLATVPEVSLRVVLSDVNSSVQPFFVITLSCAGHSLLSATGVPSINKDGVSCDNSHVSSLVTSVLAVSLPSSAE